MENELIKYQTVIDDIRKIIQSGINTAYQATNTAMIMTYFQAKFPVGSLSCFLSSCKF